MEVRTQVTQWTVSALPEDDPEAARWSITVEYRGDGKWAVRRFPETLNVDGEWEYEQSPSNRDDGYLTRNRHDLDTALRLAQAAAPTIEVNGLTPETLPAWRAARRAEQAARDAVARPVSTDDLSCSDPDCDCAK